MSQQQYLAGLEPYKRWNWSKSICLKLGSLRRLLAPQESLQLHICKKQNLSFCVSQPRPLRIVDCLLGVWMDYFYGVCMLVKLGAYGGQCQREGRAHSDHGPGPLTIQTPGSKWHQVSPIQTTHRTNANSPQLQGLPACCPLGLPRSFLPPPWPWGGPSRAHL